MHYLRFRNLNIHVHFHILKKFIPFRILMMNLPFSEIQLAWVHFVLVLRLLFRPPTHQAWRGVLSSPRLLESGARGADMIVLDLVFIDQGTNLPVGWVCSRVSFLHYIQNVTLCVEYISHVIWNLNWNMVGTGIYLFLSGSFH